MASATILDALNIALKNELNVRGVKVYIKTNLAPEIKVFDSEQVDATGNSPGLIKSGISIRDRNGKELVSYGGKPKTDVWLSGGLLLLMGTFLIFTMRGIVRR